MKRAFGVVCIICVIYLSSLMIGFYKYSVNEQNELQQLIMSYAIDYSSDAAMQEALRADDLEMDYTEDGYIIIDPEAALDTFVDMFCFNYGIGINSEARKHVLQNFIPVACVACYDGYYIAGYKPVKNDYNYPENSLSNSAWDVAFGPKLPYTYVNGGISYALNMSMDYAYAIDGMNITKHVGLPPGLLNEDAGIARINQILTDEIAYAVNSANEINANWKHSFFIPSQLSTLNGVNPITGPSLIVLVQNVDLAAARPISGFSISGSRVAKARMVVGYRRNGIKYYCYADRAPTSNIEDLFMDVREAAKAGYYFDLENMK